MNVTVSDVVVAWVTVPAAPSLKTTFRLARSGVKPLPATVIVGVSNGKAALDEVTENGGTIVAIWTTAELPRESSSTAAFRGPVRSGAVESLTVSELGVAAVTVPTAPVVVKVTKLSAAVGLNPKPLIVSVCAAFIARSAVL